MIISRKGRFVFIANTKTASTSIESVLLPYASIAYTNDPELKHIGITRFETDIKPKLELDTSDLPLESFAVVRDPMDWLFSWYRYRSRPELSGHKNSTAHLSFDQFVDAYLQKPREDFVKIGSPTGLLRHKGKEIAVDHVYAFEHISDMIITLSERLGQDLTLDQHLNRSPQKNFKLSRTNYQKIETFFERDIQAYQEALQHPRRITAA